MCSHQMRFTLITKPEQSGKTFVMLQEIIKGFKNPPHGMITVNFILCDNNLLLTKQTSERVKKDLEGEVEINGESYLEFSSAKKRTEYQTVSSVVGAITTKGIQNILCCTNGTRIDNIYKIISDLNQSPFTKGKIYFKVWLDEADKYIGFIDNTFLPLIEDYSNVELMCITATPKRLFDTYGSMNVFPLENTTCENYHGWGDNKIRLIDYNSDTCGFIQYVLENQGKDHIQSGTIWYIPADREKVSHRDIKDACLNFGFAVIIVNGEGITLVMPNREMIKVAKDDELNHILIRIYGEYELNQYPLAITGNVCIGRGVSITSEDFRFTHGILSSCGNPQEASQNSGRLKGNMKHWEKYKPPIVFTTEKFDTIAREWETKSRELGRLSFEQQQQGKSTVIDKTQFKTLGESYDYILHDELFPSFEKAKQFLKTKSRCMKSKVTTSKKSVIHKTEEGYLVTSKLLKNGRKVSDLTSTDRITEKMARNISKQTCISTTEKGSRYLILPVYPSMQSEPRDVKFQVRYLSYKE